MTATRWSPLALFLAGGLSGAALIGAYAGSAPQPRLSSAVGQHELDAQARDTEEVIAEGSDREQAERSEPDGARTDDPDVSLRTDGSQMAGSNAVDDDAGPDTGRSLAQVLAKLEAEYRSQLSPFPKRDSGVPPSVAPADSDAGEPTSRSVREGEQVAAAPPSTPAIASAEPTAVARAASPASPVLRERSVSLDAAHEPKDPERTPARRVASSAAAGDERLLGHEQQIAAQVEQLAALQQLALAQQIAASQQLAIAQQVALLQYLQLMPAPVTPTPAQTLPRGVPPQRRQVRGFVATFPGSKSTNHTASQSGFYSTPTVLVR